MKMVRQRNGCSRYTEEQIIPKSLWKTDRGFWVQEDTADSLELENLKFGDGKARWGLFD